MKISPVVGTPTISSAPQTGNSPEKLARLKAIAAGETPISVTESEENKDKPQPAMKTITMQTNRTVNRDIPAQEEVAPEPEIANSDTSVQANATREVTQPLSPQFAALAKQRRALQQERAALDRDKASLAGPTRAELEAKIKSQPLSVLQELGVTYDQLTQDILAAQGGITPEITALKAEIKALKEGVDKTFSDKDSAAEKSVLAEMRRTINNLASQGDDFELVRETRSQPEVLDLIHRTWKQTGEIMDEAEAMRLVEDDLINQSLKIAKLKKVQGKLTPEVPLEQQPKSAVTQPQTSMRTLTNKDSGVRQMSRRQRAIAAALGQNVR